MEKKKIIKILIIILIILLMAILALIAYLTIFNREEIRDDNNTSNTSISNGNALQTNQQTNNTNLINNNTNTANQTIDNVINGNILNNNSITSGNVTNNQINDEDTNYVFYNEEETATNEYNRERLNNFEFEVIGIPDSVKSYITDINEFNITIKEYVYLHGLVEATSAEFQKYQIQEETNRLGIVLRLNDSNSVSLLVIVNLNDQSIEVSRY